MMEVMAIVFLKKIIDNFAALLHWATQNAIWAQVSFPLSAIPMSNDEF